MNHPSNPTRRAPGARLRGLTVLAGLLLPATTACVTENTTTGEMVPRGNQRYPWEDVKKRAERLEPGMNKGHVLNLMGSPAEIDETDDHWTYLPERHGILVPAQALHLTFQNGLLTEHEYRSIVFGAQM